MKVDFPGLMKERLPSGKYRYRVRKAGDKTIKTKINVTPDHPRFREHYHAARAGIQIAPEPDAPQVIRGSIGWLVDLYVAAMPGLGLTPGTIHQRTVFLEWLRSEVGEYSAAMPKSEVMKLRDKRLSTPGAADNLVKTIRAMYGWALDRDYVKANPALGIPKIAPGNGATPWSVEDLAQYRAKHPRGTMAHLALSLLMFTACRIGDLYRLGPSSVTQRDGVAWLAWTPAKKGSTQVEMPIPAPLQASIDAAPIKGVAFLLTEDGAPFASAKAMQNRFDKWVSEAGLTKRTAHGVRKAAGHTLAEMTGSAYAVMSVLGHSNTKTGEVYTKGANRRKLAGQAMDVLGEIEW